jgi:hypothetical protein
VTEPAGPGARWARPPRGPAGPAAARFTVDPWDPGYGQAFSDEADGGALQESSAVLDLDTEVPADRWRPLDPDPGPALPRTVLFLDGIRRIDARIWVHSGAGGADGGGASGVVADGGIASGSAAYGGGAQPAPGIAASLAAGLVACDGAARIVEVSIERGIFTTAPDAADVATRHARYAAVRAEGPGLDKLSLALQNRLSEAEVQLAHVFRARSPDPDDLLVVDGPLRGRTHLDRTVGYIKTHHASYLPPGPAAVVGALATGQRTPVFTMGTSWRRHSWYLRLPSAPGVPWAGVVRLECSPDLPAAAAARLADLTARLLPPLASAPHKDPRAPQNLVPIGGLERELRRRLGDQQLLYRALRSAASAPLPHP